MAIRGITIIKAKNTSRVKEVANFIWSLNFKKDLMVDIAFYQDEPKIKAKVSKTRYLIYVNPNIELEVIKNHLLEKGFINQ